MKIFKGRKYEPYCAISGNEPDKPATKVRQLSCNFENLNEMPNSKNIVRSMSLIMYVMYVLSTDLKALDNKTVFATDFETG